MTNTTPTHTMPPAVDDMVREFRAMRVALLPFAVDAIDLLEEAERVETAAEAADELADDDVQRAKADVDALNHAPSAEYPSSVAIEPLDGYGDWPQAADPRGERAQLRYALAIGRKRVTRAASLKAANARAAAWCKLRDRAIIGK